MKEIFEFRLQKVLDYREFLKKQKTEELSEYLYRLQTEKETLKRLKDARRSLCSQVTDKAGQGISAGYLAQYNSYISFLETFIDRQRRNTDNARRRVEECREDLKEASIDKEIMDRLRMRHYDRFVYHLDKKREKEVENLVNYNLVKG